MHIAELLPPAGYLMEQVQDWSDEGKSVNERTLGEAVKDLGYKVLPQVHHHSPGGSGLVVAIRQESTGEHFHPHTIRLRLRDRQGMAAWRRLSLIAPNPDSDRACAGRVILTDRFNKHVEFYTFGGSLETILSEDAEVYALYSPAPILELATEAEIEPAGEQLAGETDALLGELEARWGNDQDGFERRLAEIEPLRFYMGTLHSLLERYEHCEALEEMHAELCRIVRHEKAWLANQGLWPEKPYSLADLLDPGLNPTSF